MKSYPAICGKRLSPIQPVLSTPPVLAIRDLDNSRALAYRAGMPDQEITDPIAVTSAWVDGKQTFKAEITLPTEYSLSALGASTQGGICTGWADSVLNAQLNCVDAMRLLSERLRESLVSSALRDAPRDQPRAVYRARVEMLQRAIRAGLKHLEAGNTAAAVDLLKTLLEASEVGQPIIRTTDPSEP